MGGHHDHFQWLNQLCHTISMGHVQQLLGSFEASFTSVVAGFLCTSQFGTGGSVLKNNQKTMVYIAIDMARGCSAKKCLG